MTQLILSMLIWGTLGLAVLKSGLGSIDIAFFRCLIGVLFLLPYCWYQGYFSNANLTKRTVSLISLGGVFVILNWVLLFQSFKYSSITLGNIAYYVQPVFLVFIGRFFLKEKVSALKWILIALTFFGVILTMNLSKQQMQMNHMELIGVGFALIAGLFYSFATAIVKDVHGVPASMMILLQLIIGSIMLLPFVSLSQVQFSMTTIFYLFAFGLLYTVIAFALYYQAVKKLQMSYIAVISYIDPIVAILTDILFYHRELNSVQILGIALTLVCSYFVVNEMSLRRIFQVYSSNGTISQKVK